MAINAGLFVQEGLISAFLKVITFSGEVTLSGSGVKRYIRVYKRGSYDTPWETTSDESTGAWSIEVPGGSNDEFVVICFGITGENSVIYDHIVE